MTGLSLDCMDQFVKAGDSRALLIDSVLAQAAEFKRDWAEYKNKNEKIAQFARILNIAGIPVNAAYPDLYLESMKWCQVTPRIRKANNLKMSDIVTVASVVEIKEEAIKKLGGKKSQQIITKDNLVV